MRWVILIASLLSFEAHALSLKSHSTNHSRIISTPMLKAQGEIEQRRLTRLLQSKTISADQAWKEFRRLKRSGDAR